MFMDGKWRCKKTSKRQIFIDNLANTELRLVAKIKKYVRKTNWDMLPSIKMYAREAINPAAAEKYFSFFEEL